MLLPRDRRQIRGYRNQRVVLQVRSDTGTVGHDGDTVPAQMIGGTDARQHQQFRAMERPRTDYNAVAVDVFRFAGTHDFQADGFGAFEKNAAHMGFRHQTQVRTTPDFLAQMAVRGGPPSLAIVGGRQGGVAFVERAIHIGDVCVALAVPRTGDGVGEFVPLVARDAANRDRPGAAVQLVVGIIQVGFQLAEIR